MAVAAKLPRTVSRTAQARRCLRRYWLWATAGTITSLLVTLWLILPWLTCRWIQGQTPLITDVVTIRGARWGGTPPPTMVVGVCNTATFLAIWRGSSHRWQPGALLADGQYAWGTFTEAPEITWRLDLDERVSEPRITAVIPHGIAEQLLAWELKKARAQVSDVHLSLAHLTGIPGEDGLTTWHGNLSATAKLNLNQQKLPVTVEKIALFATTTLGLPAKVDRPLSLTITVHEFAGEGPFIGPFAPWKGWLESQMRTQTAKEVAAARVPNWWPLNVHWDVRVVLPVMAEM